MPRALTATADYLSTGEAAELCSVTRDTVLKWIAAGRLPAKRTAGGHHRIPHRSLIPILREGGAVGRSGREPQPAPKRETAPRFQYCWEFYSRNGKASVGCMECIVYRSGTRRCYELSRLPVEAGHTRLFCEGSCAECEYFKTVEGQRPNVLVVTDRLRLRQTVEKGAREQADFNLRVTDCEYRCSMIVGEFRPDYVVIDCLLGSERSSEFATLLYEDPRIPFIKVILAGRRHELPPKCDKSMFAVIDRPFTVETLSDLISQTREHKSRGGADARTRT